MTTLPEPQRRALKSALRAKGIDIGPAPKKDDLLALAVKHGIDIAALPIPAINPAVALFDDAELDALDAQDAGPAIISPETLDAAQANALPTSTAILAKLGSGNYAAAAQDIETLYAEAIKPAVIQTVEKIVTQEKIIDRVVNPVSYKGHIPTVTSTRRAGELLVSWRPNGTQESRIELKIYDAPDAPAVDQDYIWPASTGMILAQLNRGRPVFLSGPKGCGKTSFGEQLAARQHRPFVRISCHEQTDAATLVGMTVPDGNNGVRWQDGILASAIRRPGTLILIDEPSVSRPGALFAFQSVLDASRALVSEETGERIPVADGVSFILADNTRGSGDETGTYAGTRMINGATMDRCGILVLFGWLPPDQEAQAISARAKCPLELAEYIVTFATTTRQAAEAGRLTSGLGPRRLISWAENCVDGFCTEAAYDASVHDMSPQEDRETLRQLFKANVELTELRRRAKGSN